MDESGNYLRLRLGMHVHRTVAPSRIFELRARRQLRERKDTSCMEAAVAATGGKKGRDYRSGVQIDRLVQAQRRIPYTFAVAAGARGVRHYRHPGIL